jgi:uncharacterized protein with ACT and thioredoxin-like domain
MNQILLIPKDELSEIVRQTSKLIVDKILLLAGYLVAGVHPFEAYWRSMADATYKAK